MKLDLLKAEFDKWWWDKGSGMRPKKDEDIEEFAKRITKIAWANGEYTSDVNATKQKQNRYDKKEKE